MNWPTPNRTAVSRSGRPIGPTAVYLRPRLSAQLLELAFSSQRALNEAARSESAISAAIVWGSCGACQTDSVYEDLDLGEDELGMKAQVKQGKPFEVGFSATGWRALFVLSSRERRGSRSEGVSAAASASDRAPIDSAPVGGCESMSMVGSGRVGSVACSTRAQGQREDPNVRSSYVSRSSRL